MEWEQGMNKGLCKSFFYGSLCIQQTQRVVCNNGATLRSTQDLQPRFTFFRGFPFFFSRFPILPKRNNCMSSPTSQNPPTKSRILPDRAPLSFHTTTTLPPSTNLLTLLLLKGISTTLSAYLIGYALIEPVAVLPKM